MILAQAKLYAAIAAVSVAFLAGWVSNGWRLNAGFDRERAAQARKLGEEAAKALALQQQLNQAAETRQRAVTEATAPLTVKLKEADDEKERLSRLVAAGTSRVRVTGARCPASNPVPRAPASAGAIAGTGTELDTAAGQIVLNLRAGVMRIETKLKTCQAALQAVVR